MEPFAQEDSDDEWVKTISKAMDKKVKQLVTEGAMNEEESTGYIHWRLTR